MYEKEQSFNHIKGGSAEPGTVNKQLMSTDRLFQDEEDFSYGQ